MKNNESKRKAISGVLETKRLITRELTLQDVEAWLEFLQDQDALTFLPLAAPTIEGSKWWIQRQLGRYAKDGHGLMALIHKESGEWVGQSGLLDQEIDGKIELEIGYHIMPRFRGKGFAIEAAQAFKEYVFSRQLSDSVISIIHIHNLKSQQVAIKNNMKRERQIEMEGASHYIYRVRKSAEPSL